MSTVPPHAQAFELGMHAVIKAAGVKTAKAADAFFKFANVYLREQEILQSRKEAYEVGVRGTLSNAGIKSAQAQDAQIKLALDIMEKLKGAGGQAKALGGKALDKGKALGGKAIAGAQELTGQASAGAGALSTAAKPGVSALREFLKKKLKSLGIG